MVTLDEVPTTVGANDQLKLFISGVQPGTGRQTPTTIVNDTFFLGPFLKEWGKGEPGKAMTLDADALAALAASDEKAYMEKMAQITQDLKEKGGATSLPERVIEAVCAFLSAPEDKGGCGFLIADKDPGDNVWYIDRADLQPSVVGYPNGDGTQTRLWSIVQVAPFG